MSHTTSLRIEIGKSLVAETRKPVPQAGLLKLPQTPGFSAPEFDFGWVTAGGAIVMENAKLGVLVLQEPTLNQGKVTWSCIVHPVEAKPNLCGSELEQIAPK